MRLERLFFNLAVYHQESYHFHYGDSQMDTDHRGSWASGSVDCSEEGENDFEQIVLDLISDSMDDLLTA
jgi:hypothetical protein